MYFCAALGSLVLFFLLLFSNLQTCLCFLCFLCSQHFVASEFTVGFSFICLCIFFKFLSLLGNYIWVSITKWQPMFGEVCLNALPKVICSQRNTFKHYTSSETALVFSLAVHGLQVMQKEVNGSVSFKVFSGMLPFFL